MPAPSLRVASARRSTGSAPRRRAARRSAGCRTGRAPGPARAGPRPRPCRRSLARSFSAPARARGWRRGVSRPGGQFGEEQAVGHGEAVAGRAGEHQQPAVGQDREVADARIRSGRQGDRGDLGRQGLRLPPRTAPRPAPRRGRPCRRGSAPAGPRRAGSPTTASPSMFRPFGWGVPSGGGAFQSNSRSRSTKSRTGPAAIRASNSR